MRSLFLKYASFRLESSWKSNFSGTNYTRRQNFRTELQHLTWTEEALKFHTVSVWRYLRIQSTKIWINWLFKIMTCLTCFIKKIRESHKISYYYFGVRRPIFCLFPVLGCVFTSLYHFFCSTSRIIRAGTQ